MHCARRRRRADAMTQTPDTKPGNYYVSIVRGKDHRLLAGPFVNNHAGALAMVDAARDLAHEIDPRTCFDAFGTCRVDGYYDKPGILNAQLGLRSEEHTSELQSLMRNSYAVFCLKKKRNKTNR